MAGYTSSKAKLTKRLVDATAALPDMDVIVWDTEVQEFRLRVRPSGRKSYEVRYRPKGSKSQRQVTIGVHGSPWTVEEARDQAKSILREVHAGADPLETKSALRASLTVAELCDAYLQQGPAYKPTKRDSSWNVDRSNFERHVKPLLGRKVARELRPDDLAEWQAKVALGATAVRMKSDKKRGVIDVRGGRGAAASAMRRFAAALEWARLRGLIDKNPAADVEKIPDGVRERYLSDEEGRAIWQAIDKLSSTGSLTVAQTTAFRLLMLTGARIGEIIGLRWPEVDLRRGLLLLPPRRNKTGGVSISKPVHLGPAALDLLKRMHASRQGFEHLFPARLQQAKRGNRDGEKREVVYEDRAMSRPKAAWARVLKEAGVTDASFHVLRHTFASQVIADGQGLYTLSKMLGHARSSTTERYAHLRLDAGAAAAQGVADRYGPAPTTKEDAA